MAFELKDRDIFIKAPKGIALFAPVIVGVVVIMILALIGMQTNSSAVVWLILVVAIAIGWWLRTKIWFAIGDSSVVVRAPFWRREIPFDDITAVEVHPDDGTNSGPINWPVTTNKEANLTRLNLGGEAKVLLRISRQAHGTGMSKDSTPASELRDVEFVTSNKDTAEEIANIVRTKQEKYLGAQ